MNVPFGLVAFFSILVTLPAANTLGQKMDWLGVIALIVAVSCLQLVLDRGERLGWFSSSEIIINTILSATAFYIFVVHCLTTEAPYITLKMLTDRNYVIGLFLIYLWYSCFFIPIYFAAFFAKYPRLSGLICWMGNFIKRSWDNVCNDVLRFFVEHDFR